MWKRLASRQRFGHIAAMLTLTDLTYRLGPRLLIDNASVALPNGARCGLVGRNGCGKSTLFRLLLGEIAPESGTFSLPRGARMGHVAQEAPGGPVSLIDYVLAADTERAALLHEAEVATDPARIAEIQIRLADIGAHAAPARAAAILSGLGFSHEDQAGRAPIFPVAGGCGSASRRCCFLSQTCCCSTNQPTISTSKARSG